jgi:hypothetical protein
MMPVIYTMVASNNETGESKMLKMLTIKCACCENGKIQKFSHVEGGVCFSCGGFGFVEVEKTEQTVNHLANRVKKAITKITNLHIHIDKLTGYEDFYLSVKRSLIAEAETHKKTLNEISKTMGEDFILDMEIKIGDYH